MYYYPHNNKGMNMNKTGAGGWYTYLITCTLRIYVRHENRFLCSLYEKESISIDIIGYIEFAHYK